MYYHTVHEIAVLITIHQFIKKRLSNSYVFWNSSCIKGSPYIVSFQKLIGNSWRPVLLISWFYMWQDRLRKINLLTKISRTCNIWSPAFWLCYRVYDNSLWIISGGNIATYTKEITYLQQIIYTSKDPSIEPEPCNIFLKVYIILNALFILCFNYV